MEGPALHIPPERADKPAYLLAYRMQLWWQPRFHILFEQAIEVDVSVSGEVVQYSCRQSTAGKDKPVLKKPLGQGDALIMAEQTLQAAGYSISQWRMRGVEGEFVENRIEKECFIEAEWKVEFQRQFHDLVVRHHFCRVFIEARTGVLKFFIVRLPSPAPESHRESVDLAGACQLASDHLRHFDLYRACMEASRYRENETAEDKEQAARRTAALDLQSAALYRVEQEVVQRNTLWFDLNATPRPEPARVAWVCYFRVQTHRFEVFVDVETQEVIGGVWHIPIGKQNKPEKATRNQGE